MAKIIVNNPRQVINGGAKKYYFKVKGLGGPKGDKGDTGATGPQGPQGPQGNAATISVGSTTTLPVGQDASVENVGSLYNAVLNFGIPQGPQGPQGAKGDKGDTGTKGDTGAQGPQGTPGTNATIYIGTTTTGEPGTQASVYNSGTDSNAVLNFTIPRGDVGPMPELAQTTGTSTTTAMSQNATTVALNNGLAAKQDKLTAGSNITISGNTISATDTTYTAGNNVQISGTVISATDTTYTAGNGLNLNGTEFSADTDVLATKEDLESYYTKTETDNLLAPKLEAEVVAELPTTGEEGKLYLTPKAHTTQTATGNPITATVAEDAGALESFQLDGDTFQQSYTGKNLLKMAGNWAIIAGSGVTVTDNDDGSITLDGTVTERQDVRVYSNSDRLRFESGTELTLSRNTNNYNLIWHKFTSEDSGAVSNVVNMTANGAYSHTYTTESTDYGYQFVLRLPQGAVFNNEKVYLQLEKSASATSYEPYVGGAPSPNPDYPQPIQTVTGLQTISINGTDYPLNLGDIELCKLNTYQDYIWKDGEDWKVHKAIAKYAFETASGTGANWEASLHRVYFTVNYQNAHGITFAEYTDTTTQAPLLADKFKSLSFDDLYANGKSGIALSSTKTLSIRNNSWTDETTARNEIVGTTMYYALATATDTVITDSGLIAQLEAIRTADLENGTNTITNTATGSNLAGDMEIGYYGFAPRNRYDKWLWLDINNEYEQIGS